MIEPTLPKIFALSIILFLISPSASALALGPMNVGAGPIGNARFNNEAVNRAERMREKAGAPGRMAGDIIFGPPKAGSSVDRMWEKMIGEGSGGGGGGAAGKGDGRKSSFLACPRGSVPCRVARGDEGESIDGTDVFECIDPLSALHYCGGCLPSQFDLEQQEDPQDRALVDQSRSNGPDSDLPSSSSGESHRRAGRDCAAIPHVRHVSCKKAACIIDSCKRGFFPSNGQCVRVQSRVAPQDTQ